MLKKDQNQDPNNSKINNIPNQDKTNSDIKNNENKLPEKKDTSIWKEEYKKAQKKVDNISQRLDTIKNNIKKALKQLNNDQEAKLKIENEISHSKKQQQNIAKFTALEDKLDSINKQINLNKNLISSLEESEALLQKDLIKAKENAQSLKFVQETTSSDKGQHKALADDNLKSNAKKIKIIATQREHLVSDIAKIKKDIKDKETKINKLDQQIIDNKQAAKLMLSANSMMETEIDSLDEKAKQAQTRLDDAKIDLESSKKDQKVHSKNIDEKTSALASKEKQLTELKSKFENLKSEEKSALDKLTTLQAQVKESQHELEKINKIVPELKAELKKSQTDADEAKNILKISEGQLLSSESYFEKATASKDSLLEQIEKAKTEYKEITTETKDASKEYELVNENLLAQKTLLNQSISKINSLDTTLQDLILKQETHIKDTKEKIAKSADPQEKLSKTASHIDQAVEKPLISKSEADDIKAISEPKKASKKSVFLYIACIVLVIILSFAIRQFVLQITLVSGVSMNPTLQENDRLLTNKLAYINKTPQKGDIIVLKAPNNQDLYIKRVIAIPGDHLIIKDGQVIVNDVVLKEPYIHNQQTSGYMNDSIPEGFIFVMGDNRYFSHDSRSPDVSFVSLKKIEGKSVYRIYPFNRWGNIYSRN